MQGKNNPRKNGYPLSTSKLGKNWENMSNHGGNSKNELEINEHACFRYVKIGEVKQPNSKVTL